MKNGLFKVLCVTSVLALIVAMGTPQIGKRKEGTSGGGGTTTGGGGSRTTGGGGTTTGGGGGGLGRRNEPPPRRESPPPPRNEGGQGTSGGGLGRREDRGGNGGGVVAPPGQLGRPDRNQGRGTTIISGGELGRRKQTNSRSGEVRYGSTNNGAGRVTVNGMRIDRPASIINPGMSRRVLDQERVGLVVDGWRNGYYHYNRYCQDDWFYYPHYVFNPWQSDRYVCSPWYYYPSLPPYLAPTRIIIINGGWPSYGWTGSSYRYERRSYNSYNNGYNNYDRWERDRGELDYALDDIVEAWERFDDRAIGRLAPRNGQVHMYFDGRYSYSLGAEDFYDLFIDGIENVRTNRYEIAEVQRGRNGSARVLGKHEYIDPWGRRSTTYHQYFLEPEGRNYVIREFGTSTYRSW